MTWQYTPYTIPLLLAGGFSGLLAVYIFRTRRTREATTISLLMLAVGIWSFSYGIQLANATAGGQLFWNKVQYLGIVPASFLWLVFALQYSGRNKWLTRQIFSAILLIPLTTIILVWTNEFHHLFWRTFTLMDMGSFLVKSSERGFWVWIHIAYSYLMIFIGSLLIFERFIASRTYLYRRQAAALLFFVLAPWAGNILFLLGITPFPHLNITPFIFTITSPVLAWGLFHFRLGDLAPVVHATVIESINDGVIVLDDLGRIIEINPAAKTFLGLAPSDGIGIQLKDAFPDFAEKLKLSNSTFALEQEVPLDADTRKGTYDIRISPLIDPAGRLVSRVIVMRDISARKLAEAELQLHRNKLEEKVKTRTAELSDTNARLLNEIAQRERVEKALRESEKKYKTIVESSNDIIMLTAPDGNILYLSPSCRNILGYEPEELTGSQPWIVHPDDLASARQQFNQALLGQSGSNFQYRIQTKTGETRWVSHSWIPITEEAGLQMIVSTVRDINEQKIVEQALRQSEERYRMLVDNSLSSIFVNQDGVLKFINKKFIETSGYSEDELLDSSFERLIYPEDRELVDRIVTRRLSGEDAAAHYEFRAVTKSGDIVWLESFGTKIDYQGRPALLVHLNDVTDRKNAEEALKESEQKYRTLIEEAKDIIYTIDLKTNTISSANSFSEEILGFQRAGVIGQNYLTMIHPDDCERLAKALFDRVRGYREPNFPFRMRKADGSFLDVEQNGAVISDDDGNPVAYLGVARDVTDRKQMEQELRRSEERYRQILNSSHDIIVVMDDQEKLLFANAAYFSYTGLPDKPMEHLDLLSLVHPHDVENVKNWFEKVISGESIRGTQYRIIDGGGAIRWVESNADSIHWPGVAKAVVNVARDITDRKAAEQALRESEERYRMLVDNSLTGVFVLQDERFQFVNERLSLMSGFSRAEILEMPFAELVHPEDRKAVLEIVRDRISGISPQGQSQFRCVIKNGEIMWVETYGTRIHYNGKPALLVNLLDVTERKKMENALRESEQKFRSLVEITSDWVWETDVNGVFSYSSPKVKDLLGYEPHEVIGRPTFDFIVPEEVDENWQFLRQRAIRRESFAGIEQTNRHKDGKLVVLESSGVPFFDSNGRILGYRGIDRDVTDRKRADEALRISEERYRSIFEETPDIFYILDLKTWMITDANKYALQLLGYGPEAIGKTNVLSIIHPDDYLKAATWITGMMSSNGKMPDLPLRILTSTGELRHIEQRGVILNENGMPKYLLGLAHDVSERKLQEEMIHKRNEKLAALYEVAKAANASPDLNIMFKLVVDVALQITRSEAACIYKYDDERQTLVYLSQKGFPAQFIEGTNHLKIGEGLHGHVALSRTPLIVHNLPIHSLPQNRPHISQIGFDSALIVPLLARDKLWGTFTVVRKPGNPYDSEDLDLMMAIANQLVVAMENKNLYSQVLEREAHLQSILQTSLDGIAVTSEDQKVAYRNYALSSMFGYDESDDLSDTDTISFFAAESHPTLHWLREKLKRGETVDRTIEFKGKRKDGTLFDAEMRLGCFFEKGKRFDVGVIRDATERKKMEFQLLQSGKLAAIGELAAGVAHEINNPISAIDVQTGLMRDILADEAERLNDRFVTQFENYLDIIEGQVRRCHLVTDNLLSFSRFPATTNELFDINHLLKETIDFVVHLSDKRPKIELCLDGRLPLFQGDPNRLEQVFVNLWNNAVRAIDCNGSITVSTGLDEAGRIRIEFKDSGVGIAPEIRDRIFDPFFTTRPEGEGTGLGLPISHYIIREMKGSIDFQSSSGNGTTFTITFDRTKPDWEGKSSYAS
ncbi:MAG: PAS domain S-box protein [Candidatus Abyssobacteria bacterium SURF_5]|uniref:histidine kinase n=1 Tax=Abyssobacteria bacterium (strain SURF_5) TaxID=2093360 RepID=A0A3A4N9L0_ABYX5|nr:MAG: PAS domain S-box protein [Candidatus Abyssubacteria bacterium SURF_5]